MVEGVGSGRLKELKRPLDYEGYRRWRSEIAKEASRKRRGIKS